MRIEIQRGGISVNQDLRDFVRRRVNDALGSCKDQIDSVRVRLAEVGEARDGKRESCRVQVCLSNQYKVSAEVMATDLRIAVQRAVDRAGWSAVRRLQRERFGAGGSPMVEHHLSGEACEPHRAA